MNSPSALNRSGGLMARMRDADDGSAFVPTEHKLHSPRARPDLVDRAGLIGRLRAREGEILAVAAPAGYGKTTLIAQWAATDERPCAWLSLDTTDNDPVVLMTYLALALDQIEPVDPAITLVLSKPSASM